MAGGNPKGGEPGDGVSNKGWCLRMIKDEFRCSNFGLSHPTPRLLVSDQWGYPRLYVGWRVVCALYHLAWIVYNWSDDASRDERRTGAWLVYLTNWTFLLLTVNTLILAVVVVYVRCSAQNFPDGAGSPWYLKASWVVYTIASVGSIMVTVLFFGLLFSGSLSPVSGETHLGNSVYVLLDLCVTAMPVRLLHVIYPAVYALVYCMFTVVYWAAGGTTSSGETFIYKPLDWNRAQVAVPLVIGAAFVGVPLVHLIFWSLYMLRLTLNRHCCGEGEKSGRVVLNGYDLNAEKGDHPTASRPPSVNVISPV
ncbi:protein rolling stone-like isoform X2 [Littorina saxatilis]